MGWRSTHASVPLVSYLQDIGVVAGDHTSTEPSEVEELLGRYDSYLVIERDLAVASRRSYLAVARGLPGVAAAVGHLARVVGRGDGVGVCEARVCPAGTGFGVVDDDGGAVAVAVLVSARVHAVVVERGGAVTSWLGAGRASLDISATTRFGRCWTAATATVLWDGATSLVLTVLVRLGLRAGEVARLELGDVDWRRGEFGVRVKGGRNRASPTPGGCW